LVVRRSFVDPSLSLSRELIRRRVAPHIFETAQEAQAFLKSREPRDIA